MEIKVYSTPTCPYCHNAKEYFEGKNIPYTNLDVSQDKTALEEMVKVSGQMGVPVITIDGEVIVGFDKERIESIVGT